MDDTPVRISTELVDRVRRRIGELAAAGERITAKAFVEAAVEAALNGKGGKKK